MPNYINLTCWIEAIPKIEGEVRFIRIQSTWLEQHRFDDLILSLDYDFLMNVALGRECVIYDYGARKPIPRAVYQGVEFIKYVLNRRWLGKEYKTNVSRNHKHKMNSDKYFNQVYLSLSRKALNKLDYFLPFVKGEVNIRAVTESTTHSEDKAWYSEILKERARKWEIEVSNG